MYHKTTATAKAGHAGDKLHHSTSYIQSPSTNGLPQDYSRPQHQSPDPQEHPRRSQGNSEGAGQVQSKDGDFQPSIP